MYAQVQDCDQLEIPLPCSLFSVLLALTLEEDPHRNAVQVNYELLIKTVDPENILPAMIARKLISLSEKRKVRDLIDQGRRKYACETVIDSLLENWKEDYFQKFIEVLETNGYGDCAAKIKGWSVNPSFKVLECSC